MYHFIYKTTNSVNGKYYKGKHSTENLDDGYIGSGLLLSRAIAKYGIENFSREIVDYAESPEALNVMERVFITESDISSDNCYNIAAGGQGGNIVMYNGHPLYESVCKKISDAAISRRGRQSLLATEQHANAKRTGKPTCMMGKEQGEYQRMAVSAALKGRKKDPDSIAKRLITLSEKHSSPDYVSPLRGRVLSDNHRENIAKAHADVSGDKNPNYGKRKYFNPEGTDSIRCLIADRPEGWIESSEWRKIKRRKS